MGELIILGTSGEIKILWDKSIKTIEYAMKVFYEYIKAGWSAIDKFKEKSIKVFDSEAGMVVLIPPMSGG